MEAYNDRLVLFTYGRAMFTILQGTWFWQIGLRLYYPKLKWDLNDESLLPNVAFAYCLHFFIILLFLFIEWAIVKALIGEASWFETSSSSSRNLKRYSRDKFEIDYESDDLLVYEKS